MQVSRVAYDRFALQLPTCGQEIVPLSEQSVAHDVAGWLWQFGPTPVIAVVEHDGHVPPWLAARLTVSVTWQGVTAAAVVLQDRVELERFLVDGCPHQRTHLIWPRVSPARTLAALRAGTDAWMGAVEGHAHVSDPGTIEVLQLA